MDRQPDTPPGRGYDRRLWRLCLAVTVAGASRTTAIPWLVSVYAVSSLLGMSALALAPSSQPRQPVFEAVSGLAYLAALTSILAWAVRNNGRLRADLWELRRLLPLPQRRLARAEDAADLTLVLAPTPLWILGCSLGVDTPGIWQIVLLAHLWAGMVGIYSRRSLWCDGNIPAVLLGAGGPLLAAGASLLPWALGWMHVATGTALFLAALCALGLALLAWRMPSKMTSVLDPGALPGRQPAKLAPGGHETDDPDLPRLRGLQWALLRRLGHPRSMLGLLLGDSLVLPAMGMATALAALGLVEPWTLSPGIINILIGWLCALAFVGPFESPRLEFALLRPVSRARLVGVPMLMGGLLAFGLPALSAARLLSLDASRIDQEVQRKVARAGDRPEPSAGLAAWQDHYQKTLRRNVGLTQLPGAALSPRDPQHDGQHDQRMGYLPTPVLLGAVRASLWRGVLGGAALSLAFYLFFFSSMYGRSKTRTLQRVRAQGVRRVRARSVVERADRQRRLVSQALFMLMVTPVVLVFLSCGITPPWKPAWLEPSGWLLLPCIAAIVLLGWWRVERKELVL